VIDTSALTSAQMPDARAIVPRGVKLDKQHGNLTPCFCVNCGTPGGAVMEYTPAIIYLCQRCAVTYGDLPLPQFEPTTSLGR
jgi:hypothetical protein